MSIGAPELFRDTDADVILLSSDDQEFHVHKLILSKASPVFHDILSLPQHQNTEKPLPVVQMSEGAHALTLLLEYIYPELSGHRAVSFVDLANVRIGLELSRKYQMLRLQERLHETLLTRAKGTPESIYAIGWEFQMKDVVHAAAYESLRNPRNLEAGVTVPELAFIPALALQRLMQYQRRCMDALRGTPSLSMFSSVHLFYDSSWNAWMSLYRDVVTSALMHPIQRRFRSHPA